VQVDTSWLILAFLVTWSLATGYGFNLLTGNFLSGLWSVLIGIFLYGAAEQAYRQMLVNSALSGAPVRRFMARDPVSVSLDLTVQSLVDDYLYRYLHDVLPGLSGHASRRLRVEEADSVPPTHRVAYQNGGRYHVRLCPGQYNPSRL
jgi:hypothetical protein